MPWKSQAMRKKILVVFVLAIISLQANSQSVSKPEGAAIVWDRSTYDFGDVEQGERVEHSYYFTNAGSTPLIITNVEVTCGCTTPKGWPRDPIAPGEKGELLVAFNSSGKYGRQNKVVTIISNAINPEGSQITFTANVLDKKIPK